MNTKYIINKRGAIIYDDEALQPVLKIPEGSLTRVTDMLLIYCETHVA